MGFVLNLIKFVVIAVLIILFAPGLPPYNVKFESYVLEPPLPLEGKLAPNSILDKAVPIPLDRPISGPESIAIRGDELFTGLDGGELVEIKNGKVIKLAKFGRDCDGPWDPKTCGRIAGVRFDPNGKLVVADAAMGIFRVDPDTRASEQLVSLNKEIDGILPKFPDDIDISKDGSIYWSDASTVGDVNGMLLELLGTPTGRLVKYDPKTKKNTVLLNGLHFANGVQLSKNEDFVLVADMMQSRIMRVYLKGPKAYQADVFLDRLPGLPDNIRSNGKDGFYIVMSYPRNSNEFDLFGILGKLPYLRRFILRTILLVTSSLNYIEANFIPSPRLREWTIYIGNLGTLEDLPPKVIIVETDGIGNIIGNLQNDKGPIARLSEINVGKQYTYFGSPSLKAIYRMKTADLRK